MDDFRSRSWLVLFKILAVVLFIYLTTPTSSHALMRAAFEDDEMPMTEEDLKKANSKDKRRSNGVGNFQYIYFTPCGGGGSYFPMGKRSTRLRSSFGVYSFLMCLLWAEMGAVDVAFTEATVGAGISTVVLVATISLTEEIERLMKLFSLIPVFVIGVLLLWAGQDFPKWGDVESPASRVSSLEPFYRQYRGGYGGAKYGDRSRRLSRFDTMFETVVVFIAGMAVIAILRGSSVGRRKKRS